MPGIAVEGAALTSDVGHAPVDAAANRLAEHDIDGERRQPVRQEDDASQLGCHADDEEERAEAGDPGQHRAVRQPAAPFGPGEKGVGVGAMVGLEATVQFQLLAKFQAPGQICDGGLAVLDGWGVGRFGQPAGQRSLAERRGWGIEQLVERRSTEEIQIGGEGVIVGGAGGVMDREIGPRAGDAFARLLIDLGQGGGVAALATEATVVPSQEGEGDEEDGTSDEECRVADPDTPNYRDGAGEEGEQPEIGDAVPAARQDVALGREPLMTLTIERGGIGRERQVGGEDKLMTPAAGRAALAGECRREDRGRWKGQRREQCRGHHLVAPGPNMGTVGRAIENEEFH